MSNFTRSLRPAQDRSVLFVQPQDLSPLKLKQVDTQCPKEPEVQVLQHLQELAARHEDLLQTEVQQDGGAAAERNPSKVWHKVLLFLK
jgi:hypothetical protein